MVLGQCIALGGSRDAGLGAGKVPPVLRQLALLGGGVFAYEPIIDDHPSTNAELLSVHIGLGVVKPWVNPAITKRVRQREPQAAVGKVIRPPPWSR